MAERDITGGGEPLRGESARPANPQELKRLSEAIKQKLDQSVVSDTPQGTEAYFFAVRDQERVDIRLEHTIWLGSINFLAFLKDSSQSGVMWAIKYIDQDSEPTGERHVLSPPPADADKEDITKLNESYARAAADMRQIGLLIPTLEEVEDLEQLIQDARQIPSNS